MHQFLKRTIAIAIVAVAAFAPALAFADGDVRVALSSQRVTLVDGKEVLVSAAKARPGDVIEYRAVYKNDGRSAVRELDATLPVPQLLLPALQVNIRAGRLPEPDADGHRYLRIPLDRL